MRLKERLRLISSDSDKTVSYYRLERKIGRLALDFALYETKYAQPAHRTHYTFQLLGNYGRKSK